MVASEADGMWVETVQDGVKANVVVVVAVVVGAVPGEGEVQSQ